MQCPLRIEFACSQPPLLSEMVKLIYEETEDIFFLKKYFPVLQKEHKYWTTGPVQVTVKDDDKSYNLSRYWSYLHSPRPESYK